MRDVVDQAVGEVAGANIDGVGQAESSPGHSSASAVDLPGIATVNKSETTKDSSKVTRLSVGGQDLLVKNGDASGGTNSGDLAAVGDLIDDVNDALCPYGRSAPNACLTVLDANATSTSNATGSQRNHHANSAVLSYQPSMGDGVAVLPNTATTSVRRFPAPIGERCTDFATNSLLGGKGQTALLSVVGLKVKVGGIFAPC